MRNFSLTLELNYCKYHRNPVNTKQSQVQRTTQHCPACFDFTYKGRKNSTLPKRRAFKPVDKGKFENTHQFIVQPSSELLTKITDVPGNISLSQHGSALSTVVTVNTLSLSYEYACAITIRCLLRIYYTSDARGPNCWYSILTYRTKCLLLHNQF